MKWLLCIAVILWIAGILMFAKNLRSRNSGNQLGALIFYLNPGIVFMPALLATMIWLVGLLWTHRFW